MKLENEEPALSIGVIVPLVAYRFYLGHSIIGHGRLQLGVASRSYGSIISVAGVQDVCCQIPGDLDHVEATGFLFLADDGAYGCRRKTFGV